MFMSTQPPSPNLGQWCDKITIKQNIFDITIAVDNSTQTKNIKT